MNRIQYAFVVQSLPSKLLLTLCSKSAWSGFGLAGNRALCWRCLLKLRQAFRVCIVVGCCCSDLSVTLVALRVTLGIVGTTLSAFWALMATLGSLVVNPSGHFGGLRSHFGHREERSEEVVSLTAPYPRKGHPSSANSLFSSVLKVMWEIPSRLETARAGILWSRKEIKKL